MADHFRPARTASVLSMALLLAIPFPFQNADAGSVCQDGSYGFSDGLRENLELSAEGLALDRANASLRSNWTNRTRSAIIPSARSAPGMAYDSACDETVLFGGETSSGPMNDTWTFYSGTSNWKSKKPVVSPPARHACGMAYDSKNGKVVLFGGFNNSDFLGDTWTYDTGSNAWTRMNPKTSPSARGHFVLIYDSANGVAVLFGGYNRNYLCDTWTYDLSENAWSERKPAHAPSPRSEYAMTFDEYLGETMLFGGYIAGLFLNDTWTYNRSTNDWTNRKYSVAPSPRAGVAMAYDTLQQEALLFGMYNFTYQNDTWLYNSNMGRWEQCLGHYYRPPSRVYPGLTYDSHNAQFILFGGGCDKLLGDTWEYHIAGPLWMEIQPAGIPAMAYNAMVYVSAHDEIVLFGGHGTSPMAGGTWTFNLTRNEWTNRHPQNEPWPTNSHSMAYDTAHDKVILFSGAGGYNNTWIYDPVTNDWEERFPSKVPPGRMYHSMTYDVASERTVMFGGRNGSDTLLNDTWTYSLDSNRWIEASPAVSPPARQMHAMVYDSASKLVILFGGFQGLTSLCDTWTFDGSTNSWNEIRSAKTPPARGSHCLAWDPVHGLALLFGGLDMIGNRFCDTWAFQAGPTIWTELDPPSSPPWRAGFAMAGDLADGQVVIFGGQGDDDLLNDTWSWSLSASSDSGTFTSRHFDGRGPAYFGSLTWSASVPPSTSLRFQFRSAGTQADLVATAFTGPDGTGSSYYTAGNWQIASQNNGSRWFQYRAYFSTDDAAVTPVLRGVTVNYNLLHELAVVSPAGGENWTGLQNISWTASDRDNDTLSYDIFLESQALSIPIAQGLPDAARSFRVNASLFPNGQYRVRIVARDDNRSIPLTVTAVSGFFTIYNTPPEPPNHPPHVWLVSPLNNSVVNSTGVRLVWLGTDPDGDPLTFGVSCSVEAAPPARVFSNVSSAQFFDLAGLSDGVTYYWTVCADDGTTNQTDVPVDVWSFTVRLPPPPVNHPPRIISTPPTNAIEGELYTYNVTASDPDNDPLAFSLANPAQGMAIDPVSGALSWTPDIAGTYPIVVMVSDGRGGMDEQAYSLTVRRSPPTCSINYPAEGATVSGTVNITGIASKGFRALQKVEVRIDDGNWTTAAGVESWSLQFDTRALSNGQHVIRARAYDTRYYSENATVTITVDNAAPVPPRPPRMPEDVSVGGDLCPWAILGAILVVATAVLAIYYRNRRAG